MDCPFEEKQGECPCFEWMAGIAGTEKETARAQNPVKIAGKNSA